jgi:hypothetical protein
MDASVEHGILDSHQEMIGEHAEKDMRFHTALHLIIIIEEVVTSQ